MLLPLQAEDQGRRDGVPLLVVQLESNEVPVAYPQQSRIFERCIRESPEEQTFP